MPEQLKPNRAEMPPEGNVPVPRIYQLIATGADSDALAGQIYQDFQGANSSPERTFLGLDELRNRGEKGNKVLQALAKDSGSLGAVARKIVASPESDRSEIEAWLGIQRLGQKVSPPQNKKYYQQLFGYAKQKGFLPQNMNFHDFMDEITIGFVFRRLSGPGQLTGQIEKNVLNFEATFGSCEPKYIELTGPNEILRLRTQNQGNFLLLGSYGKYSAREFKAYAAKISPALRTHIIDIDPEMFRLIRQDSAASAQPLIQADALKLPLKRESMDHIYTNNLFHMMISQRPVDQILKRFFKQTFEAVKPGGSLILSESPFRQDEDFPAQDKIMDAWAFNAGFTAAIAPRAFYHYIFFKDFASSIINENGFGHYEGKLLVEGPTLFAKRYIKPQK